MLREAKCLLFKIRAFIFRSSFLHFLCKKDGLTVKLGLERWFLFWVPFWVTLKVSSHINLQNYFWYFVVMWILKQGLLWFGWLASCNLLVLNYTPIVGSLSPSCPGVPAGRDCAVTQAILLLWITMGKSPLLFPKNKGRKWWKEEKILDSLTWPHCEYSLGRETWFWEGKHSFAGVGRAVEGSFSWARNSSA